MIADPRTLAPKRQPLSGFNVGYIGFTHVPGVVSDGISYFERWARLSDITVTHAFVVTSTVELVEAHWRTGVQHAPLSKYLDDSKTRVVFRRPTGWREPLGWRIAAAAYRRIGSKYNIGLIAAQLLANTFVGHYLNQWFDGRPDAWVSHRLDRKNEFICSELAAWALNSQPEFRFRGILSRPLDTISPQELFEDQTIFEPREELEKS